MDTQNTDTDTQSHTETDTETHTKGSGDRPQIVVVKVQQHKLPQGLIPILCTSLQQHVLTQPPEDPHTTPPPHTLEDLPFHTRTQEGEGVTASAQTVSQKVRCHSAAADAGHPH